MPITLPQAPAGYNQRDQDLTRRMIEQVVNATPSGGGVASGFTPIITGGAVGDTLYYDGASWRNSAFLQNTTTQVRIGGNPGTLPNPAVTPILTGLGGGYYFKATTGNAYSIMFGDGVPAGHSILSQGAGGWAELDLEYYGTVAGPPHLYFSRARGTTTAPDYPQSGDLLGRLEYHSYAGAGVYPNDRAEGARFDCLADGTWTVSSRPTRFEMYTTPSGTTASVKRLTLGENGFLTHTATDLVQLGTITALQQVRDDSVTWNAGGVVFTGWKLNVTNTASAAGSLLADLQVGGSYKFKVDKDGKSWQVGTNIVQLGTITADQQTQTQEVTWNNAGVLFVADYMNVVPTAYANGSKMLDYRVNGTSRFTILLSTTFSQAFVNITPPDNQVAIQIGGSRTGTGGERIVNIAPTVNTTGSPILVDILATHVAAGASTQLFRVGRSDNGTMFNITYSGNVGIAGGSDANVWCRIGPGGSQIDVSGGLQVNPTLTNNGALSHKVLEVLGAGLAGTYTTPVVTSMYVGTYSKAASQTITTWYGLDILAGPAAGTKWSIRAAENVWIKGNLTVDGTITGFTGIGAHVHAASDITTGTLVVSRGGTGVSDPTTGNLLVGAGASAMTLLAPGAAGGFVRSDGAAWVRNTIQAADLPTHTHAEADITDGTLLARLAANETITGTWTFDSPVTVGLGGSTASVKPGGVVDAQFNVVGNVGTGEDNLMTYTLPANSFNTAGQVIRVRAWGAMASNSNSKSIKFYFGSTWVMFVNADTNTAHNYWSAEFYIINRGTDSQEIMGETRVVTNTSTYATPTMFYDTASVQDDAAAITLKFTGEATANDDITQHSMIIEFLN